MQTLKESLFRIKSLMSLTEEIQTGFSIPHLRTLKSFRQRLDYCTTNLTRLGSGSSRVAFKIDENTVLKLAKNKKGLAQNLTEADWTLQQGYGEIIAKITAYCEDDMWIVSELARKAKKEDFAKLTNTTYDVFIEYVSYRMKEINPQRYRYSNNSHKLTPEQIDFCNNDEFIGQVMGLMADYDLAGGDLVVISSYGVVNRNGDETLVLVDYGATNSTIDDLYRRN